MNKNINLMEEFMLQEDEREIDSEFGLFKRYKVYKPDKDFRKWMVEVMSTVNVETEELSLSDSEFARLAMKKLTNLYEIDERIFIPENFSKRVNGWVFQIGDSDN